MDFGGLDLGKSLCFFASWYCGEIRYQESPYEWLPKEIHGSVDHFQSGLPVRGYALVGVKE